MSPKHSLKILLAAALSALAILLLPALASAADGNHDRIPDRWEKRHHLNLNANQAQRDQDGDHLRNRGEFLAGDNPRDRDSDDDGVMDGAENAGTIQSFDATDGRLVIDLFGTDTIAGLVTPQTRIKCEGADDNQRNRGGDNRARRSGEAEPGDDHGGHGNEPGDDNGHGVEPGDDNGGHGEEPGDDHGAGATCTSADLIPGAVVQEAELEIEHGAATFDEVELAHAR